MPLAIEQAGGYIAETGCSLQEYLGMLANSPAVMYDQAAEGADAERTIARIWRITLDRLTETPLAGQILRIVAWYASTAIPRALLTPLSEPPYLHQAIGRLNAYNLITTGGDGTLVVHHLIQAVARTPDPHDPHRQAVDIRTALDQATDLLDAAFLDSRRDEPAEVPTWRTLLPHVTALIDHAPPDTDTYITGNLLAKTGLFLT